MTGTTSPVPVIGLIGGVGSGKSHVARGLASRRRIEIVFADQIGHEVLKFPEVKTEIVREFGEGVMDSEGEVDRRKMSARVFGSDEAATGRRSVLESIVHPRITAEVERRVGGARLRGDVDAVVVDAPLLLEAGWDRLCDLVVFVDAPRATRLERVARSRGWSEAEFDRREASQWPLPRKRAASDRVVDNSTDGRAVEELERYLMEIGS